MNAPETRLRERRRRRRQRQAWVRPALVVLVLGTVFLVGLSLGKALQEGPDPTTTVTIVRTLEPLPQQSEP